MKYLKDDFENLIQLSQNLTINIAWNDAVKHLIWDKMEETVQNTFKSPYIYDLAVYKAQQAMGVEENNK